jgi:hypothetical protein
VNYTKKKINPSSITAKMIKPRRSAREASPGGRNLCKILPGRKLSGRDNLTDLSIVGKILKFIPY